MSEPKAVKTLVYLKKYFDDLYFMNQGASSGLQEAQCGIDADPVKEAYSKGQFELASQGLIAVGEMDLQRALELKIDSACLELMYGRYERDYKAKDLEALDYLKQVGVALKKRSRHKV